MCFLQGTVSEFRLGRESNKRSYFCLIGRYLLPVCEWESPDEDDDSSKPGGGGSQAAGSSGGGVAAQPAIEIPKP